MRLWIRLPLLLLLVSLIPLLLTGVHAGRIAHRAAVEQAEAQLERAAMARGEQIESWVFDRAQFVDGWTRLYPSRLAGMPPELQDGLLKAVWMSVPSSVVVALVDDRGQPVLPPRYATTSTSGREAGDAERARRLLERLQAEELLAESRVRVGAPWIASPTGLPSVSIAAPASSGPGPDPLWLVTELRLDVLDEILDQVLPDLAFALLDARGEVLAGAEHPLVEPRLLGALAGATARFAYELDGTRVMGAVAPVPGTGWSTVVASPEAVVLAPARQIRDRTRAVLLLSVTTALFLGWRLAQSLLVPVERLREAALAVADGEFGRRVPFTRSDELGDLGRAFDHMSDRLAKNQVEIHAQQARIEAFALELQDRVEQRTRELKEAQAHLVRSGRLAAVGELGAGLAHELNNPLAAVLGLSQLLRERRRGTEDEHLLDDLVTQAERCRDVVAALVRLGEGEMDPGEARVVDLRDLLQEASNLVRVPFGRRGATLEVVPLGRELLVRVDPAHGTRILAQILLAARAGLSQGSGLQVSARLDEGAEPEVEVLLEPFGIEPDSASPSVPEDEDSGFRAAIAADATRRDDWMAGGMRLWVARRLLHELGGRIELPLEFEVAGATAGAWPWRVVFPGVSRASAG